MLPGCGEQGAGLLLGPTSHSPAGITAEALPVAPEPGKLRIALTPDKLETLDFMTLGGCALQITLGKYQSALGRGASDSQRLLLNLEYLQLAPACIKHLQVLGKTELANAVAQVQNLKREQLPAAIFNATLANTEFHQFWRKPVSHTVQSGQQQLTLSAIRAINALSQHWLVGDYRASNIEFEIYLSEIAKGSLFYRDGLNAEELHRAVAPLEQQLRSVLPREYQKWQTDRGHFLQDLTRQQS